MDVATLDTLELEVEEETSKIFACPFCGNLPEIEETTRRPGQYWFIGCSNCYPNIMVEVKAYSEEGAIRMWNKCANMNILLGRQS